MHSYTTACSSKSIGRYSRYKCRTEECSCGEGKDGSVRHTQLLFFSHSHSASSSQMHIDRACAGANVPIVHTLVPSLSKGTRGLYERFRVAVIQRYPIR